MRSKLPQPHTHTHMQTHTHKAPHPHTHTHTHTPAAVVRLLQRAPAVKIVDHVGIAQAARQIGGRHVPHGGALAGVHPHCEATDGGGGGTWVVVWVWRCVGGGGRCDQPVRMQRHGVRTPSSSHYTSTLRGWWVERLQRLSPQFACDLDQPNSSCSAQRDNHLGEVTYIRERDQP